MVSQNDLKTGRINQKQRTRQALIEAAGEIIRAGRTPGLSEVTRAAMVSRATFYRYFPSIDSLVMEATRSDSSILGADLFPDLVDASAGDRVARVHDALFDLVSQNEAQFRLRLRSSLEPRSDVTGTARDARRIPLLERALDPVCGQLDDAMYDRLVYALSVMVGAEAFVALADVCLLEPGHAKEIMNWAVKTLTDAVLGGGCR